MKGIQSMAQAAEVVIVGAGPAGVAAAIEAVQNGGGGAAYRRESPAGWANLCPTSHASRFPRAQQAPGKGAQADRCPERPGRPAAQQHPRLGRLSGKDDCPLSRGSQLDRPGRGTHRGDRCDRVRSAFSRLDPSRVMTAGGAGRLVRTQGLLPGHRIVLSGSGPQLLTTAVELLEAGGQVVAVCESSLSPVTALMRRLPAFLGQLEYLSTGISLMASLLRARVPYLTGQAVVAAHGVQSVDSVTVKRLDQNGHPMDGTGQRIEVDTVCVNHGFLPSYQLLEMLGCRYEPAGHQRPQGLQRNQDMQTSIAGVFAAGDCAGIGGVEIALAQGKLAGIKAAECIGHRVTARNRAGHRTERDRLARMGRLRKALDEVYQSRPTLDPIPPRGHRRLSL